MSKDFLDSMFAAEVPVETTPKAEVSFVDSMFETAITAEIQEQTKPKSAKEVLDERLKSI